jgi:hypothetical protein
MIVILISIRRFRARDAVGNPRQLKKFLKYCAYAWGCPMTISTVALAMDFSSANSRLNPRFSDSGYSYCWFAGSEKIRAAFTISLGIHLLTN